MLTALLLGLSYGFAAGISPGPTLGLTITQTLQRGWRAGSLVAMAPLFTDLPIILLAVFLVQQLSHHAFGWVGIVGGLFVIYLGVETLAGAYRLWTGRQLMDPVIAGEVAAPPALRAALGRGILANALNPQPYLFWGTVGAQLLLRSIVRSGPAGALGFLLGFYLLLVGVKVSVALVVGRSRHWIQGRAYQAILFASGLLLLGLGLLLATEGIQLLH